LTGSSKRVLACISGSKPSSFIPPSEFSALQF
jgi:hypothetical protein